MVEVVVEGKSLQEAVKEAVIASLESNPCAYVAAVGGVGCTGNESSLVLDGVFDIDALVGAAITACALNVGRVS